MILASTSKHRTGHQNTKEDDIFGKLDPRGGNKERERSSVAIIDLNHCQTAITLSVKSIPAMQYLKNLLKQLLRMS